MIDDFGTAHWTCIPILLHAFLQNRNKMAKILFLSYQRQLCDILLATEMSPVNRHLFLKKERGSERRRGASHEEKPSKHPSLLFLLEGKHNFWGYKSHLRNKRQKLCAKDRRGDVTWVPDGIQTSYDMRQMKSFLVSVTSVRSSTTWSQKHFYHQKEAAAKRSYLSQTVQLDLGYDLVLPSQKK